MAISVVIDEDFLAGETDADLVNWHVSSGDHVETGQPLADIETAKVQLTVPAPATGTITVVAELDSLINPGETIATIEEA